MWKGNGRGRRRDAYHLTQRNIKVRGETGKGRVEQTVGLRRWRRIRQGSVCWFSKSELLKWGLPFRGYRLGVTGKERV